MVTLMSASGGGGGGCFRRLGDCASTIKALAAGHDGEPETLRRGWTKIVSIVPIETI